MVFWCCCFCFSWGFGLFFRFGVFEGLGLGVSGVRDSGFGGVVGSRVWGSFQCSIRAPEKRYVVSLLLDLRSFLD